ncbi:MAG: hypothetical protein ACRELB_21035 [Polyangiaceae bacterium]
MLVELAEQAGRRATVPSDPTSAAHCPVCDRVLTRGEVPDTAVAINTCAAHGTWFDRNGLRLASLRYAPLPPPLQFHKEDYQLPTPPPETLGELIERQIRGAFEPSKTDNDAIPYMTGARAGGTFFFGDEVLIILLAIAVLGTVVSATMHVASLLGHTVTNGPLHYIVILAVFPPFGLGIWANYQMGNAVREDDGVAMHMRHFLRWLTLVEWVALLVAEIYATAMVWYLWPAGTDEIHVPGSELTAPNARAVWACDLLFFVAALGIVVVARRVARRTAGTQ